MPGIVRAGRASLAAFDAIDALRVRSAAAGAGQLSVAWGGGQRFAYVGASGGHFAGLVTMARLQRMADAFALMPWLVPKVQTFSVQQPLAAHCRHCRPSGPRC